jgi:hypothetical protein
MVNILVKRLPLSNPVGISTSMVRVLVVPPRKIKNNFFS